MNEYSVEDVKKLVAMYQDAKRNSILDGYEDEAYEQRIIELVNNNYELCKIISYTKGKTPLGRPLHIMKSPFNHIERKFLFDIAYEDLPLNINNEYLEYDEPTALILKWRFSIGR